MRHTIHRILFFALLILPFMVCAQNHVIKDTLEVEGLIVQDHKVTGFLMKVDTTYYWLPSTAIGDTSISTDKLKDDAVTTTKITDATISARKLGPTVAGSGLEFTGSGDTRQLQIKIGDGLTIYMDELTIEDGGVDSGFVALNSIGWNQLSAYARSQATGSGGAEIPDDSTLVEIADVWSIKDEGVTAEQIKDSTITAYKFNPNIIGDGLKLDTGATLAIYLNIDSDYLDFEYGAWGSRVDIKNASIDSPKVKNGGIGWDDLSTYAKAQISAGGSGITTIADTSSTATDGNLYFYNNLVYVGDSDGHYNPALLAYKDGDSLKPIGALDSLVLRWQKAYFDSLWAEVFTWLGTLNVDSLKSNGSLLQFGDGISPDSVLIDSGRVILYVDTPVSGEKMIVVSTSSNDSTFTVDADGTIAGTEIQAPRPSGANPTTSAAGDLAVDTDDGFLEFYDTGSSVVSKYIEKVFTIIQSDSAAAVDDSLALYKFDSLMHPHGATIKKISVATGESVSDTLTFREYSNRQGSTKSTIEEFALSASYETAETSLTDANMAADAWFVMDMSKWDVNCTVNVVLIYEIKEGD